MININNLTRPQNIGQAVNNDNNSLNPYNGLNVSNLSKPSDKQESQTISALYNLLLNNDTIRWDSSGNIKIRSPHGLTTIKKIKFRSFTGDLLPYTNLELPELNIKLQAFCSDELTDSVYLIGRDNTEGITPKHIITSEQQQETKDSATIIEFNKAWTYNSDKDSQIEYNIEELINYLNECLLDWFGNIEEKTMYGIYDKTQTWRDYKFSYSLTDSSRFSYQPCCITNKIVRIPYIENNDITYKIIDFSTISFNTNGVISFPNGAVIFETMAGNSYGAYSIYNLNTNSFVVSNNYGQHHDEYFSLSRLYSFAATNNVIIRSPYFDTDSGANRSLFVIYRLTDNTTFEIKNTDFAEYNKWTCIGAIENYDGLSFTLYYLVDSKSWDTRPTNIGIMKIIITLTEPTTTGGKGSGTAVISARNENAMTYTEYYDNYYFDCNKGLYYDINKITHYPYIDGYTYTSFEGQTIIKEKDTTILVAHPHTQKITLNNETFYLSNQEKFSYYNNKTFDKIPYAKHTNISNITDIVNAFNNGYFTTSGMIRDYLPTSYTIQAILSTTTNTPVAYYQHGKMNNIVITKIFKDFDCYCMASGQKSYPMNTIDNKITYNNKLFTYEDGQISFPSICWSDTKFLTFVPIITTNPKYFNMKYDIPQKTITTNDFSIVQTETNGEFHALNTHVFTTLETLLLLKYEYNDLMLRCNNFPNNDNFVFSINESCEIDFKTMQANSNNQELNINLTDSGGDVIMYETLKALYGKVVLCIDWEG